jgi:hypothetical protein
MKRISSKLIWQIAAILFAGIVACHSAMSQGTPPASLEAQLKAQYRVTKIGLDSGGIAIVDAGTVFVIQKGGILGVPPNNPTLGPAIYKDGELHPPSPGVRMFLGNNTRFLQVGEKVYVVKLDVNSKGDKVTLTILECDSCNGVNEQSSFKSQVIFQYPKGALLSADPGQVEDTIGQILAIDNGSGGGQQDQNSQAQQSQSDQQAQPQQQAPPHEPQTIQLGQTTDQVQAILGQPDKIVNLGAKQIYIYKDLKVTFVNGKVTDAQ